MDAKRGDNREFAAGMRKRTGDYAVRAIRFFLYLREGKDGVGEVIGRQFLRSATSIGANIAEAYAAESKADFLHKYSIARKEIYESLYWLSLLTQAGIVPATRIAPFINETKELASIITAIVTRTRANSVKRTRSHSS
jgi:four helix bundle protein